ncbi:hypothetical protein EJ06DRAFT_164094 [Trichodelitschia bisporula]|uniref:Uncharacterized protein n=1 Tax=Trichodelitschia bisporula TaxID=703511 RepID=A0A6G1HMM9_9PEZI|nr:hypothetical protein EJ06DRAFT_164094 [Trichodelitschia bisporula]
MTPSYPDRHPKFQKKPNQGNPNDGQTLHQGKLYPKDRILPIRQLHHPHAPNLKNHTPSPNRTQINLHLRFIPPRHKRARRDMYSPLLLLAPPRCNHIPVRKTAHATPLAIDVKPQPHARLVPHPGLRGDALPQPHRLHRTVQHRGHEFVAPAAQPGAHEMHLIIPTGHIPPVQGPRRKVPILQQASRQCRQGRYGR